MATPSKRVIDAFIAGHTRHTRRVEIYEPDGVTRWRPDVPIELVDGSVSVNYGTAERRTLDLTLGNEDGLLQTAPGGIWYDKIIKVFRGIDLTTRPQAPRVAVVGHDNDPPTGLRKALSAVGYKDTKFLRQTTTIGELSSGYDMVILYGNDITATGYMATQLYQASIPVFVIASVPTPAEYDLLYPGYTGTGTITYSPSQFVAPANVAHPVRRGWEPFQPRNWETSQYESQVLSVPASIPNVTYISQEGSLLLAAVREEPSLRRKFAGYHLPERSFEDVNLRAFLKAVMQWLDPVDYSNYWETQLGEFMVDRIRQKRFPASITVTGRDYSKKMMGSKFIGATEFNNNLTLEGLINTIAGSAGIVRRLVPQTGLIVGRQFSFDRGSSKWDALQEVAGAFDYEVYFNATGYLVLEKRPDPAEGVPEFTLQTGMEGTLVEFEKSASDARMYNVILVTGESTDTTTPNVWAVARNDDPSSPTSVPNIGERVYEYSSSFITTTAQAQQVANTFLGVHALEEFEITFDSLMLPWLDVGSVVRFMDPNPLNVDPDTYLMSSLSFPLSLAPMSASGKRVVKVV